MANMLESLSSLLRDCLEGDPPKPSILEGLDQRIGELFIVSADPSGEGLEHWLSVLRSITGDAALRETLLVRSLQKKLPRVAEALALAGAIGVQWEAGGAGPRSFSINWDYLSQLMHNPGSAVLNKLLLTVQKIEDVKALQALILLWVAGPQALLKLEYEKQGFLSLPLPGVPGADLSQLLALINSPIALPLPFAVPLDLAALMTEAQPPVDGLLGTVALEGPAAFDQLDDLAVVIRLKNPADLRSKSVDLGDRWQLTFATPETSATELRLQFGSNGLDQDLRSNGTVTVLVGRTPAPDGKYALLLGAIDGTHFAVGAIRAGITFIPAGSNPAGPLFGLTLQLDPVEFAVAPDFLKFLNFGVKIPPVIIFESAVNTSYLEGNGPSGQDGQGNAPALGVQFSTDIGLSLGSPGALLAVDSMTTRLEVAVADHGLNFRAMFRYGARAELGPLKATMDGAGVWLGRWTNQSAGLLPPTGIGISLKAGPVAGGGFLAVLGPDEFGGALQLKVLDIGAFAYGLYKTLPGGGPSFVALIGIRLPVPGIQVGFGFAVSGFGGLVGINREANTDLLRERLASGAAGDVLFNQNPMQNAPKLLGDMNLFFPAADGIFLIGPTLQLNWLSLFTLDVGLFIELPGPRKIFIAGSARLVVGSEDFALVYLRMDFVGGIDLTKSLVFFDGALVNSQILGFIKISGGIALRMAYGVNGYFLFSVGGFHPSFNPGNLELPKLARAGIGFDLGIVWFKQEMYLAITSNTFQFGTNTEAGVKIGPFGAHGWFRFDALIQFKPFHFEAGVDAGFDIEFEGVSFCGVRVRGTLSGPGPLVLHAEASVRIIIKISKNVTITLDGNPPEKLPTIANLAEHLKEELGKPANVRTEGTDPSVVFAAGTADGALLSAVGDLVWEQKRVPLNLDLQKAEGIDLGGWRRLEISCSQATAGPEFDLFGTGTFLKLSDAQALNSTRFIQEQSGLRLAGSANMKQGPQATKTVTLRLVKLPTRSLFALTADALSASSVLSEVLGQRFAGAPVKKESAKILVHGEAWSSCADGRVAPGLTAGQATAAAARTGALASPAGSPALNLAGVL